MSNKTIGEIYSPQDPALLQPDMSVADAARLMADRNVGSALVLEKGELRGIFTERDLLRRVVAAGRDPKATRMSEVMTPNPISVTTEARVLDALEAMRKQHLRHLPVTRNGKVIGILSVRDLMKAVIADMAITDAFPKAIWEGFEGSPV